jgi:two-component system cell cycle sensor histidine kinase/response regulator CckA
MIIELLQNMTILMAVAVGLQLLARRLVHRSQTYAALAGLMFGAAGVFGMLTPLQFAPGVIYDGRSVVLSLAGLVGGPVSALMAAIITGAYRLSLGGAGAIVGIMVIAESALLGALLHRLTQRDARWRRPIMLWLTALLVHVLMLATQLILPGGQGWAVIRQIGPAIVGLFPLGFVITARVFQEMDLSVELKTALRTSEAQQRAMIACTPLALYSTDAAGVVRSWNEWAAKIFGWPAEGVLGRPLPVVPGSARTDHHTLARRALEGETIVGQEIVLQRRDGSAFPASLAMSPLKDRQGRILGLVSAVEDITERKATEQELRDNEHRFRSLVEGAPDAIFVQVDWKFAYLNNQALVHFGAASAEELIGQPVMDRFDPDQFEAISARIRGLNENRRAAGPLEQVHRRLDGSLAPCEVSGIPIVYDGRNGALVFVRDISQRKELEQRLLQAQKLEAVGRLAGGIAHDFNNMLQTILGYTELLLQDETDPGQQERLEQVRRGALRSADLTRQLLGFARKQVIKPAQLDLNEAVGEMLKMLQRLIGENIDLLWQPHSEPCPVVLDAAQLDQVLANLVVNARDAIDGVGRITIETAHVDLDGDYCRDHPGFAPGAYEMLAVSDDGAGMDKATLAKVFEPFFTTKDKDRGTGLGLATVYGIVKQNEGFINIYSEVGRGTTVRIYLRRAALGDAAPEPAPAPAPLPRGGGRVLLVEDEPDLLVLCRQLLARLDYSVIAVDHPREAIALVQAGAEPIDVLLTDVIMPGMTGKELYGELRKHVPELRCIFMSGYTSNAIAHHGVLDAGVNFLQKPFSGSELAHKLHEVLGDA